eukprot:CAMPEP_0116841772 /NCGR_PEP_ID=MMETSP0418-20121206/11136_1 /TAXON_ID=1158023 /ORGANISM="Astrosyne radiata, Strain 13vi08-1A" /LENGTH=248 /DNA_ID=CAMNT_0004472287 /DNA_START=37 /DNA_END=783 /DNA_ORIENTATION=-
MAKMDRGSDALKNHLEGCSLMDIRQTRRGWLQDLMGCEARVEFRYFIGENQIAHSLEDSECCMRIWCSPCHPFTMEMKELNTDAEMVSMDRPCRCAMGGCKCCCYQEMTVSSGGQEIGSLKEDCWYCVPSFQVYDPDGTALYKIHPPTCCGGCCVNCCTEGNPCCGKGCCKVPFWVFPASQEQTDGDAPHVGKILKKPKSAMTEIFTEANAFDVIFPEGCSIAEKGTLIGSAIFINANFFEDGDGGSG